MFNNYSKPDFCQLLQATAELAKYGTLTDPEMVNFDQLIDFIMDLPNNIAQDIAKLCYKKAFYSDYSKDICNSILRAYDMDSQENLVLDYV